MSASLRLGKAGLAKRVGKRVDQRLANFKLDLRLSRDNLGPGRFKFSNLLQDSGGCTSVLGNPLARQAAFFM
jgi:hypothetical protein